MPKVKTYPFATITEYPELGKKLKGLLRPLGRVVSRQQNGDRATVTVKLKKPAEVWGWDAGAKRGVSVNSSTNACITGGPSIYVYGLQNGVTQIKLTFDLSLDSRVLPVKDHNAGVMKEHIKSFAREATHGWCSI